MKNQKEADTFWETDLADMQKAYLPEGVLVTDLCSARIDWRVPVRDSPLIAMDRIARWPKDKWRIR